MDAKLLQSCPTLCDPIDCIVCQAPLPWNFPGRLSCPPLGDLPGPGIRPASPAVPVLAGELFTTSATWEAQRPGVDTYPPALGATLQWELARYHVGTWKPLLFGHLPSHNHFHLPRVPAPSCHWPWVGAAAKSLQSCPTLCDPIDGSPPGSPVPGILQARTLEWVAISFSNAWKWTVKVKSLSRVRLLATPWSAAHQAPPSMGFSRQEYWSGVPLLSPSGS